MDKSLILPCAYHIDAALPRVQLVCTSIVCRDGQRIEYIARIGHDELAGYFYIFNEIGENVDNRRIPGYVGFESIHSAQMHFVQQVGGSMQVIRPADIDGTAE
jgi:hypothetical protein